MGVPEETVKDNIVKKKNNKDTQVTEQLSDPGLVGKIKNSYSTAKDWIFGDIDSGTAEGQEEPGSLPITPKSILNLTSDPLDVSYPQINTDDIEGNFQAYMIECSDPIDTKQDKDNYSRTGMRARRPILGTAEKRNTFASLYLTDVNDGGAPKPQQRLYDSLEDYNVPTQKVTVNFLIQSINQAIAEQAQIIQTFGKTYFLFFGQRPMAVNLSGVLLNTPDFNWRNDFIRNYMEFLRGGEAAVRNRQATLAYDDLILSGYIMGLNTSQTSEMTELVNFRLDFIVTKISIMPSYDYESYRSSEGFSTGESSGLTKEYFEYVGAYGNTTKDGKKQEDKSIYVYTSFPDILANTIGFNYRSITRIKTLSNIIREGDAKTMLSTAGVTWSNYAKKKGAHVYELDRIFK